MQVVKIADTTLKKRLEEFKNTPSGSLTLADFRTVWLDEEMDPPAFTKGKEREEEEKEDEEFQESGEGQVGLKVKAKRKVAKKRKRKRGEEENGGEHTEEPEAISLPPRPAIDPALLNEGILAGAIHPPPLFIPEPIDDPNMNIDPALLPPSQLYLCSDLQHGSNSRSKTPDIPGSLSQPPTTAVDETASIVLAEEVSTFLQNTQGSMLSNALDVAEQRRLEQITVTDELLGLDEAELDRFLLTEEEVKIKERVWVELNKDYLEAIAGTCLADICF